MRRLLSSKQLAMQIKVCGLKAEASITALAKSNADLLGFIFYPPSARNIAVDDAIIDCIQKVNKHKVGVFVNADFHFILQVGLRCDFQYIQLHGEESPELVKELSQYFKVIKAFAVDAEFDFRRTEEYHASDYFLFDTKGKHKGGNGMKFNWSLLENYKGEKPYLLSGGIGPSDVEALKLIDDARMIGIDINSGFEISPGQKAVEKVTRFIKAMKNEKNYHAENGYYGQFGGAYIPELLYQPVEELAKAFNAIKDDEGFKAEYLDLLKNYVGRPTPLYYAKRLSEKYKTNLFLKREDLNHTGAHKVNNTIGQILLAKRMGKTRIIAETGAGQHGVATATVCALMGIECVVYMGAVDIERQQPNVGRMKMLGATVIPAKSGSQTLKDATNEAIRDWINNPDSFYLIGSVVGPAPYPEMVAHFQSIISEEIKKQLQAVDGKENPDMVIACVGGGSNAAGAFFHFLHEPSVELVAVEASGHGIHSGKSAATSVLGSEGIIHGSRTLMMQDEYGQIIEPHSISAGLDYPGIGPLHAHLIVSGRCQAVSITDQEALKAGFELTQMEGIIPALESAHALAALAKLDLINKTVVLNLSGRGDKDLDTYLNHLNKENYATEKI